VRRWLLVSAALACEAPRDVVEVPAAIVAPALPAIVAPVWDGQVPEDPAAVRGWLQAFAYHGWAPQTEIRMTGEHGGERLYFNDVLAASWQTGAPEHPVGSAAVRELYTADLKTLKGFALMHKTGPSGQVGEGWFWYEIFGTTDEVEPTVAQAGARTCVGCHAHAVDFVHSPDTPRADPQPLL
jgi:hypothetical protein